MLRRDIKWSDAEKKIARRAFDAALESALAGIIADFKRKAVAVTTPSEMWDIEDYLSRRRREIDETFDYRYSQLLSVFAQLLSKGYLDEAQIAGLSAEKLETIRDILSYLRRD